MEELLGIANETAFVGKCPVPYHRTRKCQAVGQGGFSTSASRTKLGAAFGYRKHWWVSLRGFLSEETPEVTVRLQRAGPTPVLLNPFGA